tara:strand:- start:3994 stop:4194 length:201 start_codon:yes stop_codon:yes gene_type:complete
VINTLKKSFIFYILSIFPVEAYIGPGLALGAAVVSLGVVLLIIFFIIAVLYYPLKKFLKKIKKKKK